MEQKKLIQLPRYKFSNLKKAEAINAMNEYINEHLNEFTDGEEITLRYLDNNGESQCSVNAIIDIGKNNNNKTVASLSVDIGEYDTVKIIETEEEPEDKESLWLTDWDKSAYTSDLKSEVKLLKLQLKAMQEMLNKHDYALSNTLAGGDIIVNSEKYDLENKYEPEQPEDSKYEPSYDTGDTKIVSYDLYIAETPLSAYTEENVHLYRRQKYYLKLRTFNIAGHEVDPSGSTLTMIISPADIATINGNIMYASKSGDTTFVSKLITPDNDTLMHNYALRFEQNEKPDYETYEEPNVHHMLIKKADTKEILEQNAKYLLECEFCWCIDENALFLKAKAKNGTTQLFKINGEGSITPTGETVISYTINETGVLEILDEKGEDVYIDAEGILHLVGNIDDNGILSLNNTSPNQ